jgi:hypothetical protein
MAQLVELPVLRLRERLFPSISQTRVRSLAVEQSASVVLPEAVKELVT